MHNACVFKRFFENVQVVKNKVARILKTNILKTLHEILYSNKIPNQLE